MMLFSTELTLRTTKNGVRLFSKPIQEIEKLQSLKVQKSDISIAKANETMQAYNNESCLRIRTTIKLSHATGAGLSLYGQNLLDYDMNGNRVNRVFYSPEDMTSMEITADIILDKTSVEVFIDGGAYSYSMQRKADPKNQKGFNFFGHNIEIKNLEVYKLQSIW